MKTLCLLLSAFFAAHAYAGDFWEVASTSVGLDGKSLPYSQQICLPNGDVDPSQLLGGGANCAFDQKSGNASAMAFSMNCEVPGMPAELGSIKVTGDAKLSGDRFDMRYNMSVGESYNMTSSMEGHKIGQCSEQ